LIEIQIWGVDFAKGEAYQQIFMPLGIPVLCLCFVAGGVLGGTDIP